ncbi:MAG: transposase family protein [Acidimicrobiaceae bacterium]|nr:transposase family protein [Acidimicrobiaceae bacterium]
MTARSLDTVRIDNDAISLAAQLAKAGQHPKVIVDATYGWYWAADVIAECGGRVHLAHSLGSNWGHRGVKNDERDATDLVDLLRMGRLAEAWVAPPAQRELGVGGGCHSDGVRRQAQLRHAAAGAQLEGAGLTERTQALGGGQHANRAIDRRAFRTCDRGSVVWVSPTRTCRAKIVAGALASIVHENDPAGRAVIHRSQIG